jgi:hypothetical protein
MYSQQDRSGSLVGDAFLILVGFHISFALVVLSVILVGVVCCCTGGVVMFVVVESVVIYRCFS